MPRRKQVRCTPLHCSTWWKHNTSDNFRHNEQIKAQVLSLLCSTFPCTAFMLGWSEISQKMPRCRENAFIYIWQSWKCVITCKQTCDQNECKLWIVESTSCSIYKVKIISLEFKWLILLGLAMKTCNQMHQVLKNVFATSLKRHKKCTFTHLVHWSISNMYHLPFEAFVLLWVCPEAATLQKTKMEKDSIYVTV